jgi:hypothetical protein
VTTLALCEASRDEVISGIAHYMLPRNPVKVSRKEDIKRERVCVRTCEHAGAFVLTVCPSLGPHHQLRDLPASL